MNLETKRNAIMNAIASGKLTNLIPDNLTWSNGYYNSGGGVTPDTSSTLCMNESEYIDIDTTQNYRLVIITEDTQNQWAGICEYSSTGTFIKRETPISNDVHSIRFSYTYKIRNPKIRVSLRTYGEVKVGLFYEEEILELLKDNGDYLTVIGEI